MATLWIAESRGAANNVHTAPFLVEQTVAISGSSTQSAALNSDTRLVSISTDVNCHILLGTNPTATTSKFRLGTNERIDLEIKEAGLKIAVIAGA